MADTSTNIKVTRLEKSEVEISGDISVEAMKKYRGKALKDLGEKIEIQGFRKGHVPEKILVDRVGEILILEEAAELALKDIVPDIIEKNVPDYIGRPKIAITKLAPGNPVSFKITIGVMPEIKLPDYKKIAKKELAKDAEKIEVTEKEINEVIEQIRKQRAHQAFHEAHKDHHGHDHSDEEMAKHLPEFTDEFVKTLGAFESVADFRAKAKENMIKEKEHRALEKRRGQIFEKLIAETKVELPEALIENESNRMLAQFESDIAGMGLKSEDYLKHIKKTPEDLQKEWRPDAEKRATLNVVLAEIAKKENLRPDEEMVKHEVEHMKQHYPEADEIRVRAYIEHSLTLEKVIKFLEEQE